jgi:hypothetical protein
MKKYIFSVLLIVLIGVSCATTPDAGEAISRANEARQRAIDFESPEYFPSEWEEAEALFAAADNAALYNAAADAYDELFRKTIPLYAQAREDEIMAVREHLIHTGFTDCFPEYLKNADEIALAAQEQYEAGDYYGARDTAAEAMNEYETLMLGARIFLARQEIIDRGFTQYDYDNFLRADEVAQTAISEFDASNRQAAIESAEEALLRFNLVLANGWVAYAADRRAAAALERELALAERANIAVRDIFREAETFFTQAEEFFAAENYSDAAIAYIEAEALYAISRKETAERRARAEEVIRMAEEKIEESSEAAAGAERLIEGGTR